MPTLIAKTDNGNFTDASTWGVAETGTGALQTDFSASTQPTTSYVYSPTFTITNGSVIEGVLIYVNRLTNGGTLWVALSDDNGVTATRETQINVTDFGDAIGTNTPTWVFVKFATPLTGDGGSDYRLGIKHGTTGNMTVLRSSTAADWARIFRTSTTAAPDCPKNAQSDTVKLLAPTLHVIAGPCVSYTTFHVNVVDPLVVVRINPYDVLVDAVWIVLPLTLTVQLGPD